MRKITGTIFGLVLMVFLASGASAATIGLFEWAININSAIMDRAVVDGTPFDPIPPEVDVTSFDELSGLGSIIVTLTNMEASPTDNFVAAFFDHEIDESINTFFNENGETGGVAAAGQSWEIDEPGYAFGDIFDNFLASTLDNINAINTTNYSFGEDVSMAMGWNFVLGVGETAVLTFNLTITEPTGFFLRHFDPESIAGDVFNPPDPDANVYLSSSLRIPEPFTTTMLLLAGGYIGLLGFNRRRNRP